MQFLITPVISLVVHTMYENIICMYFLWNCCMVWFCFAQQLFIEKGTTVIDVDTVFNNQVQETHNLII